MKRNSLLCDCDLDETWNWLREHRVHYTMFGKYSWNASLCGEINIDSLFSNSNCSSKIVTNISVAKQFLILNDFATFKQYIEPIILIILLVFGLSCNGFLLFVLLYHSDMCTKHNACITHLSLVDILSLFLNLPTSYWDVVNVRWDNDETLCKIYIFSKDLLVGVAVFSVVALTVERFLMAKTFNNIKKICKPGNQLTSWLLVMTWIPAGIVSLPAYFSAVVDTRCLYCPPGNEDYIRNVWTFQFIAYCLLPAVAITFFNIQTSRSLNESIRRIPGEIKDIKARNRKTVADMVLVLVLVFFLSYLPNYILRVLVAWSLLRMEDVFLISFFSFCLFFCNILFNPVSIFIMGSKFNSYAYRYLPFIEDDQKPQYTPVPLNRNPNRCRVRAVR